MFVQVCSIFSRDGDKVTIKAEELVVGDIVEVKFGDRIPADIRVLEARSFKVSRSVFNGGGGGCPLPEFENMG